MDNVGTFQKNLTYIGGLEGVAIADNAEFLVPSSHPTGGNYYYLAYTGNRVNLYIDDRISAASRAAVGASIGIAVGWCFGSVVSDEPQFAQRMRDVDWRGATPYLSSLGILLSTWQESKIEYATADQSYSENVAMSSLQVGELSYDIYKFPMMNVPFTNNGNLATFNRRRIIPLVARGDFMRIIFWSDPNTWTGAVGDRIDIFALSGSDVAGSQVIGGGHG